MFWTTKNAWLGNYDFLVFLTDKNLMRKKNCLPNWLEPKNQTYIKEANNKKYHSEPKFFNLIRHENWFPSPPDRFSVGVFGVEDDFLFFVSRGRWCSARRRQPSSAGWPRSHPHPDQIKKIVNYILIQLYKINVYPQFWTETFPVLIQEW